jgi:hypothetical protein
MRSPARFGVVSVGILAALSVSASGCSLFFVNGPPANHRSSSFFGCTSSNGIPIVDTGFAAGAVVEALAGGAIASANGTTGDARLATGITYGAAAALFAASAAYGFKKTSECREAQAELVARLPPPGPMPALARPVPYDPWVARPAPPPPDDSAPTVTPAPPEPRPPGPASPWEAPSPAP